MAQMLPMARMLPMAQMLQTQWEKALPLGLFAVHQMVDNLRVTHTTHRNKYYSTHSSSCVCGSLGHCWCARCQCGWLRQHRWVYYAGFATNHVDC
jgi:hypothetical protein